MERVTQKDRIRAAEGLAGTDPKIVAVKARILAGQADDHPSVRAIADAREFARLTPEELANLRWSLGIR